MKIQQTLSGVVGCEGIGLHNGDPCDVVIHPAAAGTGIRFVRTDLDDSPIIYAHAKQVSDTFYATTLASSGVSISTVEHLLSAFYGMGVYNATVHLRGSELPILDGSAAEWVSLFQQVGPFRQQNLPVPELVITKPVAVKAIDQHATLYPSDYFSVDCTIDFPHPMIGIQNWTGELNPATFEREIAPARTFGHVRDAAYLQSKGRAKGANPSNAIVIDDRSILSPGGLRFENEFVRHKVLDAVGDLALIGLPIRGHLVSYRAGHRINQQLMKVLLDSRDCWEISCGDRPPASTVLEAQIQRVLRQIL